MEKIDDIVKKDPLKLKQNENSYVTPKVMYLLVGFAAVSFILSTVFFCLNKFS